MLSKPTSTSLHAPIALFLLGAAGVGKTTLARQWVRQRVSKGEPWAHIDRDQVSGLHTPRILELLGSSPDDRDSPLYKQKVRDLDYEAALVVAREQLELGISVVLPGPWTKELNSGRLQSASALGLPAHTRILAVGMRLALAERKRIITARAHPADTWKLQNWDQYVATLAEPSWPAEVGVLDAQSLDADLLTALGGLVGMPPSEAAFPAKRALTAHNPHAILVLREKRRVAWAAKRR